MRPRIRYRTWPRPALIITDTPRPHCTYCQGHGGWLEDYADHTVDYGGTNHIPCDCWQPYRAWTLLRLPQLLPRRRARATYSTEPPF